MDISFLIVTRNRPADLNITLEKLRSLIDLKKHEVCVFIDGCKKTMPLINQYNWVQWSHSARSISASPARNALYKKAKGDIYIGLDDDAHPISLHFIKEVEVRFRESVTLGILAFKEVRGIFTTDQDALLKAVNTASYQTNDFIGCGFAIRKEAYKATDGFPVWMDIYGEEPALSLEVMNAGYDIFYDDKIRVNHRIDAEARKSLGRNYFRFKHQLRNTIRYYMVYYPKPMRRILKTLYHNFRKYALGDWNYFRTYCSVVLHTLLSLRSILKYRKPVDLGTIHKKNALRDLNY